MCELSVLTAPAPKVIQLDAASSPSQLLPAGRPARPLAPSPDGGAIISGNNKALSLTRIELIKEADHREFSLADATRLRDFNFVCLCQTGRLSRRRLFLPLPLQAPSSREGPPEKAHFRATFSPGNFMFSLSERKRRKAASRRS